MRRVIPLLTTAAPDGGAATLAQAARCRVSARARSCSRCRGRGGALRRLRPPLSRQTRTPRDLQGALQPGRHAVRARRATSPRCSAIPRRRSPSSIVCPEATRSRSGCWAATSIAGTARTGSRRRRCATTRRECRPTDVTRGRSRDPGPPAGRPHGRLLVQRAADHGRVGGGGVPGRPRGRVSAPPSSPTAIARRKCSTTSGRGPTATRSISRP